MLPLARLIQTISLTTKDLNCIMNNILITEPDVYVADQQRVLFVADSQEADLVMELFAKSKQPRTIYWATGRSSVAWTCNVGSQSDYIILDCKENDFFTGFFIDKPNTFYYNSVNNLKSINVNTVHSASDFVLKLLDNEE